MRSMIKAILTADDRSDSNIHVNSNSKPISFLLLTTKRRVQYRVQSNARVHVQHKQVPNVCSLLHADANAYRPQKGQSAFHIRRYYIDIDPRIH